MVYYYKEDISKAIVREVDLAKPSTIGFIIPKDLPAGDWNYDITIPAKGSAGGGSFSCPLILSKVTPAEGSFFG